MTTKQLIGYLTVCLGLIAPMKLYATEKIEKCGTVTIANMNWASAEFAANLDKFILEHGYGCEVSFVAGDSVPTMTSMIEKGKPDIASELWVNAERAVVDKAVDEGKLVIASQILKDGGVEGWWIPMHLHEKHPDIKTVADALKRPELFPHPEDKTKAAFMNCPAGWKCEVVNKNLFTANKLQDAGFELIDSGSAAGLEGAIARANERKLGWFGYYWAPTPLLGKYPMYRLDFGVEHDPEHWKNCTQQEDCKDPKPNAWTKADVYTLVSSKFAKTAPQTMTYLNKRQYSNELLNGVLAWMTDNQADGEEGAEYFLKQHENVWQEWVPTEVAKKVKAAL